jgi:hypothetical protein
VRGPQASESPLEEKSIESAPQATAVAGHVILGASEDDMAGLGRRQPERGPHRPRSGRQPRSRCPLFFGGGLLLFLLRLHAFLVVLLRIVSLAHSCVSCNEANRVDDRFTANPDPTSIGTIGSHIQFHG